MARSRPGCIGAETIRPLLHKLLPDAAFNTRPRLSTLSYSEPKRLGKLPPRSAVIVFSVRELYEVAARLRRERGGAALVFGALSPRTRNAQVGLYQAGDVDHLVATDAIGMGLNLDIDHVVFTGLTKFDGVGPRALTPAEVGQIAGGPGRHVRDGHFASTAELGPLDRRLVEAVETHRFAPLAHLYWRTDELDFFSPLALLGSLDRQPPQPVPPADAPRRGPARARRPHPRRRGDGPRARPRVGAPAVGGLPGPGLPGRPHRGATRASSPGSSASCAARAAASPRTSSPRT